MMVNESYQAMVAPASSYGMLGYSLITDTISCMVELVGLILILPAGFCIDPVQSADPPSSDML